MLAVSSPRQRDEVCRFFVADGVRDSMQSDSTPLVPFFRHSPLKDGVRRAGAV
jgi:hypothetical protein